MAQISIDLANAILSGDGVTRHELEQFCIFFINATHQIKQLERELKNAKEDLRDRFAAKAMLAIITLDRISAKEVSEIAYMQADAMLAERNKGREEE